MPHCVGFGVVVELIQRPKKTEGGILLPEKELDRVNEGNQVGYILEMAEGAYRGGRLELPSKKPWVNVGDLVYIVPYAGRRIKMKDEERHVRIIHDEDVVGLVDKDEDDWEVCRI